jgi:hypothetical protein
MSLLHLVHQSVSIKFSEAAREKFSPGVPYLFRLTGVDAMGFIQIQELKEDAPEPVWINKDLVLELQAFDPEKNKAAKAEKTKLPKAKAATKTKEPKAILN